MFEKYPFLDGVHHDMTEIVDGLKPGRVSDVDVISKKIKSNGDFEARREAYIRVCEVIV